MQCPQSVLDREALLKQRGEVQYSSRRLVESLLVTSVTTAGRRYLLVQISHKC
jgi:hypothetical protein